MKTSRYGRILTMTVMVLALASLSCKEAGNDPSPVELVASLEQETHVLDFSDDDCGSLGTVTFTSIIKRPSSTIDQRFLDIRLDRYRVSYQRTDGGTLVPAPFVRSLSLFLPAGEDSEFTSFLAFEPGMQNQAPFVALLPSNGGRDPETGQPVVKMDVVFDFFGETLSGEDVAARARMPITFCVSCGGCV